MTTMEHKSIDYVGLIDKIKEEMTRPHHLAEEKACLANYERLLQAILREE